MLLADPAKPVTSTSRLALRVSFPIFIAGLLLVLIAVPARAQSADTAQAAPQTQPAPPTRDEAEQNVVTMPTTQSMHRFGHHFRITHRFTRELGRGSFGELASDLFGLDEGAVIGLDYRFAPTSNVQVGVYRSMQFRTIQFSGRVDAIRQTETMPLAISGVVSVEGTDNFRDDRAPVLGAVVSRTYGRRLAFYASPTFVWNSQTPSTSGITLADETTGYVGLGGRVLLPKTTYIAIEVTPRVSGFAPGRATWGVGIEKHTRGHLFQLNFSNSFGTTYGQIARGGERSNVYLGFNLARKF
jgi:hypothetical protein